MSIKGQSVYTLTLSPRTGNKLCSMGFPMVADLLTATEAELLGWGGFGAGMLLEVKAALATRGLALAGGSPR